MSKFMSIKKDDSDNIIEYHVYSKKPVGHIGFIEFDIGWQKWVFNPDECTKYDAKCLMDIVDWLDDIKVGKLEVDKR